MMPWGQGEELPSDLLSLQRLVPPSPPPPHTSSLSFLSPKAQLTPRPRAWGMRKQGDVPEHTQRWEQRVHRDGLATALSSSPWEGALTPGPCAASGHPWASTQPLSCAPLHTGRSAW